MRSRSWITATLVGIALTLAGCGGTPSDDTSSATPSSSPTVTIDGPALTQTIDGLREELTAPGVAVLIRSPEGDFALAEGTTQVGGGTPVTLADHVRIGSNTKTFTTTAILQLADEGKIDLSAPVAEYWQGIPNGKRITIEQLLNMRSGLFNYSQTKALNRSLDEDPQRVWAPRELLRMGISRPPYFPPGEGWHYSNTNTVLLGLIAEKIEGKPLNKIIEDRFLTPLRLTSTSFPPSDTAAIPETHPQGYMYGTNISTMKSAALSPEQQQAAGRGALQPNDVTGENPSWTWAAGQMISTAGDLAAWVKAIGSGAVLSPELQQQRMDSLTPADSSLPAGAADYGWGIAKMGPMYGHTGELPGFNSFMGYDPVNDVTVVVWANLNAAPDGSPVATTLAKAIIGEIYGAPAGS